VPLDHALVNLWSTSPRTPRPRAVIFSMFSRR